MISSNIYDTKATNWTELMLTKLKQVEHRLHAVFCQKVDLAEDQSYFGQQFWLFCTV